MAHDNNHLANIDEISHHQSSAPSHKAYSHSQYPRNLFMLSVAALVCLCTTIRSTVSLTRLTESYETLIMNDQEQPTVEEFAPHISSFLQIKKSKSNTERIGNYVDIASSDANHFAVNATDKTVPRVCFVTAQFLTNLMSADRLMNPLTRPDLYKDSKFHFLAFTNHPDFRPRGWTVLLRNYTNYRRDITKSRWPKFQGYQDPVIQSNCDVVFYFDGPCTVIGSPKQIWNVSWRLLQPDSVSLAQVKHPKGGAIRDEFLRILQDSKDLVQNVNRSLIWMRSQPDYRPDIPIYQNKYFAYNPHSTTFQNVANFFWNHYSKEEDSWRDQPLWAYSLHHFNVTPLALSNTTLIRDIARHRGMNGHRYNEAAEGLGDSKNTTTNVRRVNVTDKELCFIHVGQTGGDRLRAQFANGKKSIEYPPKLPTLYKWRELQTDRDTLRPYRIKYCNYMVVWVRDPVERAVAAYHAVFDANLVHTLQSSKGKSSKLKLQYLQDLQEQLQRYGDFNSLAEQLYDEFRIPNKGVQRAFSAIQHIQHSIAWYFWSDADSEALTPQTKAFRPPRTAMSWLTDPKFLKKLVFVGTIECYEQDEERFATMVGVDKSSLEPTNSSSSSASMVGSTELSSNARRNLEKFFAEDYEVLRILKSFGLLQCDNLIQKLNNVLTITK
jgi:hypothetical protein